MLLLLGLFVLEDWRTVDPLSKAFFGTFSFGNHEMLSVSKRANEIGGPIGRDQLVYNLQFLEFPRLVKKITQDIPASTNSVLTSSSESTFWLVVDDIDDGSGNETFETDTAKYRDVDKLLSLPKLPDDVFYVEFPNFENSRSLADLESSYRKRSLKSYDLDGYQMSVIHFSK